MKSSKLIFIIIILNFFNIIYSAPVSEQIIIDQIGYKINSDKFFMIADPRNGQNAAVTYVPGASVQLRRSSDNQVMQTINLSSFNSGNVYTPAGDVVWQGNFSSFTTPGTYHIYDPTNDRQSYNFEIGDDIYNTILRQAVKSYFYQRCGTAITSTHGGVWTHAACHTQQQNALLYNGGVVSGTQRNVSGGWHDAGDYRKYVTFTFTTLWDLLHAYEWYPDRFSDDTGIPESGNGIPDILDEIKYELDWLLRMQRADGVLYSGVFVTSGGSGGLGDPSTETTTYYYANYSTAATVTGAMAFALGARIFAPFNATYSTTLRTAAENAWAFLEANPNNIQYNHSGFQNANANWENNHEKQGRVAAAAELFHLTGQSKYRDYVDANYNSSATAESWGHQPILSGYFETGGSSYIQRGLVSYCLAPGATSSVVTAIKNSLNQGIQNQTYGQRNTDAYKAYMWDGHYCWGSNQIKAEWANLALWGVKLNVNPSLSSAYLKAAEEYLHYFHGRNPLSWCYLTQSNSAGADKQITQIYHSWFWDGSSWDTNPAPGFLAGGPNDNYENDVNSSGGTVMYPPGGEPPQKSYRDWNTNWPDCSWAVTEPGIYYQARYVFLCAAFAGAVATPTNTPTLTYTITPGGPTFTATTPPPFTLIYDGDTVGYRLSDGTVNNGGSGTMTQTTGGKTGNGMLLTYTNIQGWWQEHWWDKTTNVNIGSNTYLVFDVKAVSGSVNQFLVRINWSDNYQDVANYLVEGGGIDTTWKTARIPLSALLEAGQTQIDFINFIANWNTNYTVMVDNIRLEGAAATATFTTTSTGTFTQTFTFTNTHTRTFTITNTPTQTITNTNTMTNTRTLTHTPTHTSTNINTNTFTYTFTQTNTPTQTLTFTNTNTVTNSLTETFTFTLTSTRTQTNTNTDTMTFTITNTPTDTFTPTETVTGSQPPTWTNTNTFTATDTPTSTHSFTAIFTETFTLTPTLSYTSTNTASFTYTFTNTTTETPLITNTSTNSFTYTVTQTFTFTFTPTITNSNTQIPTNTFTTTRTVTSTATHTFTMTYTNTQQNTVTFTNTPTFTATAIEEEFKFDEEFKIINYPNPVKSGNDLKIRFKIKGEEKTVIVRIYTNAFRLIFETAISKSGIIKNNEGVREITIKNEKIKNIANGSYSFIIIAKDNEGREIKSHIRKIMFIK